MDQAVVALPIEISRKRLQVLDAAAQLFMSHGYGATSMDAISRAAGVSKATVYAHFASKDALFATIVGDRCRANTVTEENFPAEVTDIKAALIGIGLRVLRFLLLPGTLAIYRIVVAESARFPELGVAFMSNGPQAFRDRFRDWVTQQTQAGHFREGDPRIAAEQFMALLRTGIFMRATLALSPAPDETEIEACVAAAVATFLRAFGQRTQMY